MRIITDKEFKEEVFEIAFGDRAINKEYSNEEVINKLREYSDKALEVEEWTKKKEKL